MVELVIHFEIHDHASDRRSCSEVTNVIAETRQAAINQFFVDAPTAYIVDIEEV